MTEWTKKQYNSYYNSYVPWLEDKYLAYFGENKTSYTAKENLKSMHPTGDKNLSGLQDTVADTAGDQLASKGLLGGVGDLSSKEGMNRAERGDTGPIDKEELDKRSKGGLGGMLGGK